MKISSRRSAAPRGSGVASTSGPHASLSYTCEREQLVRGPRELHVALDPRRAAASVCPACDLSLRHRVVPMVHTIKFEIFQVNSSIAPYPHPSYSNEVWAGRFESAAICRSRTVSTGTLAKNKE